MYNIAAKYLILSVIIGQKYQKTKKRFYKIKFKNISDIN